MWYLPAPSLPVGVTSTSKSFSVDQDFSRVLPMVAEPRTPHSVALEERFARRGVDGARKSLFDRLTSLPVLAVATVTMILLAMGPLQELDLYLAKMWLYRWNADLIPFAQNVLDRLSSQIVCVPVLATVAIVVARRRRSWRPLVIAGIAEACFALGVGALKVFFARGVTYDRDPSFFEAGLLEMGTTGISFPSGHASESILLYGTAVYLISRYTGASQRLVRVLRGAVAAIAAVSVSTSFLLGWHWLTDLLGGLLIGGVFLRLLVDADQRQQRRADDAELERMLSAS